MTAKEIEGNEICGLFACVGPNIKRMNLNIAYAFHAANGDDL